MAAAVSIGAFPKDKKTNLPQISFWEVNKATSRFERVIADFVEWEDHAFRVVKDGQVFVYASAYNLNEMLLAGGILRGFAYAREGENARIYPLPNRSTFDAGRDVVERYKAMTKEERDSYVYGPELKELEAELRRFQGILTDAIRDATGFLSDQVAFAQTVLSAPPVATPPIAPASTKRVREEKEAPAEKQEAPAKNSKKDRRPVELLSRKGRKGLKKKQAGWLG